MVKTSQCTNYKPYHQSLPLVVVLHRAIREPENLLLDRYHIYKQVGSSASLPLLGVREILLRA